MAESVSPYDDPHVSAGEIADYLDPPEPLPRPAPDIHLISPPLTAGTSLIIREAGQRQEWQRVQLNGHQLDYYDLADLWPGWHCWHHEGRYLSDHTLRHLNWLMCPLGGQPHS